jgi:hypothetical protein
LSKVSIDLFNTYFYIFVDIVNFLKLINTDRKKGIKENKGKKKFKTKVTTFPKKLCAIQQED